MFFWIYIFKYRSTFLYNKKVSLTEEGIHLGKYLLYRHNILTTFFQKLNKNDYHLEEVEKIEHYLSIKTIKNLEKIIKNKDL